VCKLMLLNRACIQEGEKLKICVGDLLIITKDNHNIGRREGIFELMSIMVINYDLEK